MAEEGAPKADGERAAPKKEPIHAALAKMENVIDKLKVLDYEEKYLAVKGVEPISRWAFAMPAPNASVQFALFLDVSSWLMTEIMNDPSFFKIDKFDDPNTSVNKMMLALRKLEFGLDFPASKLKAANGEPVVDVLDFLTDKALASAHFVWGRPNYAEEADVEEAEADDDADAGEIADEIEAEAEVEAVFSESVDKGEESMMEQSAHHMIAGSIDPVEWQSELERVGPRLKLGQGLGGKEWRAHIQQTRKHESTIQVVLPEARGQLEAMGAQVKEAVEKVKTKEKYINAQFEGLKKEYADQREALKAVEARHGTIEGTVGDLTSMADSISEQLEEVKSTMSDRSNSMTDSQPLKHIKDALNRIKKEISTFELRIGVVNHTLMQAKLKTGKRQSRHKSDGGKSVDTGDDDGEFDDDGGF